MSDGFGKEKNMNPCTACIHCKSANTEAVCLVLTRMGFECMMSDTYSGSVSGYTPTPTYLPVNTLQNHLPSSDNTDIPTTESDQRDITVRYGNG